MVKRNDIRGTDTWVDLLNRTKCVTQSGLFLVLFSQDQARLQSTGRDFLAHYTAEIADTFGAGGELVGGM